MLKNNSTQHGILLKNTENIFKKNFFDWKYFIRSVWFFIFFFFGGIRLSDHICEHLPSKSRKMQEKSKSS